jgi:hypothetical protein
MFGNYFHFSPPPPPSVLPFPLQFLNKSFFVALSLSHLYFLSSFILYYAFPASFFVSDITIHVFKSQKQQQQQKQQKIFFFLYPRDAATFGGLDFQ